MALLGLNIGLLILLSLTITYDPQRATALLETRRSPRCGRRGTMQPPARFHFTCLVPQNFALWERMALIAQRDLAANRRRHAVGERAVRRFQ